MSYVLFLHVGETQMTNATLLEKRLKSILIIFASGPSNTLCLHTILWSDSAFCYCLFLCWNIEVSPQPLYILLLKACLKGCLFEAFEKEGRQTCRKDQAELIKTKKVMKKLLRLLINTLLDSLNVNNDSYHVTLIGCV